METKLTHWLLRRLLHVQAQLPAFNSEGKPFSRHGRSHQYLWNQYFLDNSEQARHAQTRSGLTVWAQDHVPALRFSARLKPE